MEINLKVGDILVDIATGDVGLLISRYSLVGDVVDEDGMPMVNLWAWDIFWVGPNPTHDGTVSRYQPYTEGGLYNLIRTGTFELKERKCDG